MSQFRGNLRAEFHDRDYRHVYAEESLNTYIATQIKILREQRNLTQSELAALTGMKQPRIAVMEDINYSSWSINTLRRLAEALDLRLSVKFETFSSLIPELESFSRESLERSSFADDGWFHKKDAQSVDSPLQRAAYSSKEQTEVQSEVQNYQGARVLSITSMLTDGITTGGAAKAAGIGA
jgi:transcriptional regulator with XRE-family HTH domain